MLGYNLIQCFWSLRWLHQRTVIKTIGLGPRTPRSTSTGQNDLVPSLLPGARPSLDLKSVPSLCPGCRPLCLGTPPRQGRWRLAAGSACELKGNAAAGRGCPRDSREAADSARSPCPADLPQRLRETLEQHQRQGEGPCPAASEGMASLQAAAAGFGSAFAQF